MSCGFLALARCPPAGWTREGRWGRLSAAASVARNLAFCFLIRFASAGASGAVRGKKMPLCNKLAVWVSLPKSTAQRQQPRLPVRCSHVRPKLAKLTSGEGVQGRGEAQQTFFLLFLNHIKFEIILRNNRKMEREQCEKLKDSSIFIQTDQSEIFYLLYNFKNLQQLNYSQHCEWHHPVGSLDNLNLKPLKIQVKIAFLA